MTEVLMWTSGIICIPWLLVNLKVIWDNLIFITNGYASIQPIFFVPLIGTINFVVWLFIG